MNQFKRNTIVDKVDAFVAKISIFYKVFLVLSLIVWFAAWFTLFFLVA